MQQPGPMFPIMPSFPPTNITTEQIQKFLDENKKLILAILDNQNLGKLDECAQYQAHLQKNLMYLAAIADAQPQTPTMSPQQHMQMSPHPALAMQQGGFLMQHPQAVSSMTQQPGMVPQKMPLQFGSPLQMPAPQQLHQGLMGMGSAGPTNKQDVPATGASGGGDSSASGHGGVGGDLSSQMKATEESK